MVRDVKQSTAAFRQSARLFTGCNERAIGAWRLQWSVLTALSSQAGTLFAGTPDQVFQQIKNHWEYVGGYGHLLIMGQAGFLEHDDTVHGIRMFAREVYPRLKQFSPDGLPSGTFEQSTATAH